MRPFSLFVLAATVGRRTGVSVGSNYDCVDTRGFTDALGFSCRDRWATLDCANVSLALELGYTVEEFQDVAKNCRGSCFSQSNCTKAWGHECSHYCLSLSEYSTEGCVAGDTPQQEACNGCVVEETCRPVPDDHLTLCRPYISNTSMYYQPSRCGYEPLDWDKPGFGPVSGNIGINALLDNLSPDCASNVIGLICSSMYKKCNEVQPASGNGPSMWLPSLVCRSECETRRQIWQECISELEDSGASFYEKMRESAASRTVTWFLPKVYPDKGSTQKRGFEEPVDGYKFAPPPCNAIGGEYEEGYEILAFLFGRWPDTHNVPSKAHSIDFPSYYYGKQSLYPSDYSVYNHSGVEYHVECTTLSQSTNEVTECPDGFRGASERVKSENGKSCVKTCPDNLFTENEQHQLWLVAIVPSFIGSSLNCFVAMTWGLAGKIFRKGQPLQLKIALGAGLLFTLVFTIPVLALKSELPCSNGCDTEECVGTSLLCAINRSSPYFLLMIQMSFASLVFDLYRSMKTNAIIEKSVVRDLACVAFPLSLLLVAYLVEGAEYMSRTTEEEQNGNGALNVSRHVFSCSMRFPDMLTEWMLLWIHFLWSGLSVLLCAGKALRMLINIDKALNQSGRVSSETNLRSRSLNARKSLDGPKRRIFTLMFLSTLSLLLNMTITVWTSVVLKTWNDATELYLQCELHGSFLTHKMKDYDFELGEIVCDANNMKEVNGEYPLCKTGCQFYDRSDVGEAIGLACCATPRYSQNTDLPEQENPCRDQIFHDDDSNLYGHIPAQYFCDCSCKDLSKVESKKPPTEAVGVALFAQAIVLCILGGSTGFKQENLAVWKNMLKRLAATRRGSANDTSERGIVKVPPESQSGNYYD